MNGWILGLDLGGSQLTLHERDPGTKRLQRSKEGGLPEDEKKSWGHKDDCTYSGRAAVWFKATPCSSQRAK